MSAPTSRLRTFATAICAVLAFSTVATLTAAQSANAATTNVGATSVQSYREDGFSAGDGNYFVGFYAGKHYRDVLAFDLSGLTGVITGVELQLATSSSCMPLPSDGAPDTYTIHGIMSVQDAAGAHPPGSAGMAIYNELGSGPSLGSTTLAFADQHPILVTLNAAGIAAANAAKTAGAPFGLGGTYAEGAIDPQNIFAGAGPLSCPVQLSVTTAPAAQTIDFPAVGPVTYGVAPFDLTATASSGLPVTFAVIEGACSLAGAKLSITGAGFCRVRAEQAGDDAWLPAEAEQLIIIDRAPTVTTLVAAPPTAHLGTPVTLTATVAPAVLPFLGPDGPAGMVAFFVDGSGVPIASAPLAGGSAHITTTFSGGKHTVTARYSGDVNFVPSDSSGSPTSVEVPCDRTITGSHSALTVTSGLTCLVHATIGGGVSVAKGASLDVEKSTVNGSISANAPAGLRICGSHTGAVSVSASSAPVLIGDPPSCAHNTISAGVTAANNRAGVTIVGNTIGGSVTAAGNTGGQVISGNHH